MTFVFNVEKTSCVFSNHKVFTRRVCLDYSADKTETTWKWQGKTSSNFHVWASACVYVFTGHPHAPQNSEVSTLPLRRQQHFLAQSPETSWKDTWCTTLSPSSILDLLLINKCPSLHNFGTISNGFC